MSSLRDKAYEELDYLSQITEVVISPENELLASFPNRVELSLDIIIDHITISWYGPAGSYMLDKIRLLEDISTRKNGADQTDLLTNIESYFTFEISPDFELDIEGRKITGSIFLVKTQPQLEDHLALKFAVYRGLGQLVIGDWPSKDLKLRIYNVLNVFDPKLGDQWISSLKKNRITYKEMETLKDAYKKAILDNQWRIRDTNIIVKIADWIDEYLQDKPNNKGLVNLLKLKIMVDRGMPIYSIEEVV